MANELQVLVVEDRWMLADAFRLVLEGESDIASLLPVTGVEAIAVCRSARPDVILVDADLRDTDGFALVGQIRLACPDSRVVMLSELPDRDLENRAAEVGASSLVSTRRAAEDLPGMVRQLAAGGRPFDLRERGTDLG